MSGVRRAYLDRSPGEARGVVTLDGRPERLLLWREGDATPRLGARYAARVEAVSQRMGLARLDLGEAAGVLRMRGDALPVGRRLRVEVVAEPVRDKPALVRPAEGDAGDRTGRLEAAPDIAAELAALGFPQPVTGEAAREAADDAEAAALAVRHAFPDGLELSVEPTRALTAVDVDLAEGGATPARANLQAVVEAARLLRLKALGGLVALDLVGFPKSPRAVLEAAEAAFAPDGPGVSLGPVSRFGVLELAKPHGRQPLHERLLDSAGRPAAATLAHAAVRALERQGRFEPGALLLARRAPAIAALAAPLAARLGPRFRVEADLGAAWDSTDIQLR